MNAISLDPWLNYRRSAEFISALCLPTGHEEQTHTHEHQRLMAEVDRVLSRRMPIAMAVISGSLDPAVCREMKSAMDRVADYMAWVVDGTHCIIVFSASMLQTLRPLWNTLSRRSPEIVVGVATSDCLKNHHELRLAAGYAHARSMTENRQLTVLDPTDALRTIKDFRLARAMLADLTAGGGEFEAHFQPLVAMASGAPVGAETLARWRLGDTAISPEEFIPIAEDTGLIGSLGSLMFSFATRALNTLRHAGIAIPQLSLNVSPKQLEQGDFLRMALNTAKEEHIKPGDLTLEITDSPRCNGNEFRQRVMELHRAGFGIAIDDFGLGASNLGRRMRARPGSLGATTPIAAHIRLQDACQQRFRQAQFAGMTLLAERIESVQQAELLLQTGCRIGQGFHWSRPMSMADLPPWWQGKTRTGGRHG